MLDSRVGLSGSVLKEVMCYDCIYGVYVDGVCCIGW